MLHFLLIRGFTCALASEFVLLFSCSDTDVVVSFSDYPADCAGRIAGIDFDAVASSDLGALANFAADFCDMAMQPLVDLLYDCFTPEDGDSLTYTCRINENGDTHGMMQ